jgi:hypothetical protein
MPDNRPGSRFPPSYDTSTPGVVVDQVTGLIWQRNLPATYEGCTGNIDRPHDSCTWNEAADYCHALALDGKHWRLPSMIELASLYDATKFAPAIDAQSFPNTPPNTFWTASPFVLESDKVWQLHFGGPLTPLSKLGGAGAVRCVRSQRLSSGLPSERYVVDRVADTITDTRTQLTWQRSPTADDMAWGDAHKYCEALGNGFHLPSAKELMTVVDPLRVFPALASVFPAGGDSKEVAWTDTAFMARVGSHNMLDLDAGMLLQDYTSPQSSQVTTVVDGMTFKKELTFHAWCVR